MTYTEKRIKYSTKNKKLLKSLSEKVKGKWLILLCLTAANSYFDHPYLSALPLVVLQLVSECVSKYICGGIILLYYLSTVTKTAACVPHTAFVFIWLIADFMLEQGSEKKVYPAVISFAAAKIYLLSYGCATAEALAFVLETAGLVFLPPVMEQGIEMFRDNRRCNSTEQLLQLLFTMVALCFAAGGTEILNAAMAPSLLVCTAMLYAKKENPEIAVLTLPALLFLLADSSYFMQQTIGFGVIILSAMFFADKGTKGCCGVMLVALSVTVIFLGQFNSLAFIWQSGTSLVLFIVADKTGLVKAAEATEDNMCCDEGYIKNRIEKLNSAFRFLGHSVIDISNIVKKDTPPISVEDAVAEEICRKCKNNMLCWQQNYSDTQRQFNLYANGVADNRDVSFDSWFYSRCSKTDQLAECFERTAGLAATQRLMRSAGAENQRILQKQFLSMADILQEITHHSQSRGAANAAFTHAADNFLKAMGKKTQYCICSQNPNRCTIATKDSFSERDILKIKAKLESIYSLRFSVPQQEICGDSIVYTFSEVPLYWGECCAESSGRYKNCGDVWEHFTAEEYSYVILADGMGTGGFAQAEAKTATELLKSLLCAGVMVSTAIETVNTAFNLKGMGQSCVALDVLKVNLNSGRCSLYKAGGSLSIKMTGGKTECMYKDSLPIGVLKEVRTARFDFTAANGDTVILMSDGVETDRESLQALRLLKEKGKNDSLCEYLIHHNEGADDATAVAFTITRA